MDNCYDKHDQKYLITYKPTKQGTRTPQWAVCEWCYETKRCFNNPNEIESVGLLVYA